MNGYLVAEEGPLMGLTLAFEESPEKNEWTLGRDPDSSDIVLDDPMVSRRHSTIRSTPEGFIFENLSEVNPATQNGKVIAEPILLHEGDILQVGSTFFRFTETAPEVEEEVLEEETPIVVEEPRFSYTPPAEARWLLKVISGPNAGAEFAMHRGKSYIIGKDPNTCDIIFQDLSVSRQHAKLSVDEDENVSIEDLGSRNGVIVNGELIGEERILASQDLVALGTTTFLVVDRTKARETIISPPIGVAVTPPEKAPEKPILTAKEKRDWREMIIPKRHLIFAGVFAGLLFIGLFATMSLFKSEMIVVKPIDESQKIREAIAKFSGVQFSYNQTSGKLFLVGHVLTGIEKQELIYLVKDLPYVSDIEDNIVVDELVWQNMNDMLLTNPNWVGVSIYAPAPGRFVMRGYLQTMDQQEALNDYINMNFPYLDRLDNQVVIEKNLQTEIQNLILGKGYGAVTFELAGGELVLGGRVEENRSSQFMELVRDLKRLPGVRNVKNLVAVTTANTAMIDLSTQYQVTGTSKRDEKDYYVVINGKILGQGDVLDGMMITKVQPKDVQLEKDGVKYKINYNLQ